MTIETKNLRLIECDSELLMSAIQGNDVLSGKLNVRVAENWTMFGIEALQYSLDRLSESYSEKGWWTYLPIYKEENLLIGSGGYKGKPSPDGTVEIGYEIAAEYRNRGLATEMAKALIEKAFNHSEVKSVIAHTLGEENPSTKVLRKCFFKKVEELNDPVDGLIWKWQHWR